MRGRRVGVVQCETITAATTTTAAAATTTTIPAILAADPARAAREL
jgi:hypothetical protein